MHATSERALPDETTRRPVSPYGEGYFRWQSEYGRFGGWANLSKFARFVSRDMAVLDFGCGGGYLLANIDCRVKRGIEINPVARTEAERQGIHAVASATQIENGWADLIISNHALEHCTHPLDELRALLPKLARGGTSVFCLPCEGIRNKFKPGDRNHHLYTWSPMSAANLFAEAGYEVVESKPYLHVWPPRFLPRMLKKLGRRPLFEFGCRLYGILTYLNLTPCVVSQIRVVAKRPLNS